MLNKNSHSPHQGLGGLWAPHVPEGNSALGTSTSTGHSCSMDKNGYKPAPTSSLCPSTLGYREG